jgi:hypothetical protein
MARLNAAQEVWLTWYGRIVETHETMPEEEKQALVEWERMHLDGATVATSDWPGWEKSMGKRPRPQPSSDGRVR